MRLNQLFRFQPQCDWEASGSTPAAPAKSVAPTTSVQPSSSTSFSGFTVSVTGSPSFGPSFADDDDSDIYLWSVEEELSKEDALEVDSVFGQDDSDMEMEDEDFEDESVQLFGEAVSHKHVAPNYPII
jgi:hypothetical protein